MSNPFFVVAAIDDDDTILAALGALLPMFDCTVELYGSAAAFAAALTTTRASCLMIDIHLGTESGLALGRALVQGGFRFPIIYMTGCPDAATCWQARDAGGVAFLRKPFMPEELSRALDAARRHKPAG